MMQELRCPYCNIFDEYPWQDLQTAKDLLGDHIRRKHKTPVDFAAPKNFPCDNSANEPTGIVSP